MVKPRGFYGEEYSNYQTLAKAFEACFFFRIYFHPIVFLKIIPSDGTIVYTLYIITFIAI